jgi:hypothetical protein
MSTPDLIARKSTVKYEVRDLHGSEDRGSFTSGSLLHLSATHVVDTMIALQLKIIKIQYGTPQGLPGHPPSGSWTEETNFNMICVNHHEIILCFTGARLNP